MANRIQELGRREYPQTWLLLDVVEQGPRLVGQEVVDLSPGAIELRHVARDLRRFAEDPERWLPVREESIVGRLEQGHRRPLSFGPDIMYCVEHDGTGTLHEGKPFRHLTIRLGARTLTPATSAEIGLYFYGRRSATFGLVEAGRTHGFIGMEWEPLDGRDIEWLLQREMRVRGG